MSASPCCEVVPAARPRLLLVPGSQRAESFNARLLDEIGLRLAGRCEVDLLPGHQVDLPLFNQDLESDPAVMARVAALHRRFAASHGLVVASPEYNGQLPPYLKNLVDWVSRLAYVDARHANPFVDRPVLLCTASTGWSGGAVAIPQARALFGYVGGVVIGDTVSLPYAGQAWTGDGFVLPPELDQQIDGALDRVWRLAGAFAASTAPAALATHP
jgi:NAD(P)H-dependent FMN reductase